MHCYGHGNIILFSGNADAYHSGVFFMRIVCPVPAEEGEMESRPAILLFAFFGQCIEYIISAGSIGDFPVALSFYRV